jgi:hypothetical protein
MSETEFRRLSADRRVEFQRFAGYHSVGEARELAGLRVATDAAARLSSWLPPRTVTPLDDF